MTIDRIHGRARVLIVACAVLALGAAWFFVSRGSPERSAAAPLPRVPADEQRDEPSFLQSLRAEVAPSPAESIESTPAARVEAPASDPSLELTQEEIAALRAETPPRTLEILVFAGRERVQGARIALQHFRLEDLPPDLRVPLNGEFVQRTDARGLAVFTDLEPDEYLLNVRAEPALATWLSAHVGENAKPQRLLVLFGAGGVRGRVFQADGSPRAGAIVFANYSGGPEGRDLIPATTTDLDGAYVLGGMPSGGIRIENVDLNDGAPERFAELSLAPGEWKTIDFGSPRGASLWRGTLSLSSGEPVSPRGRFQLRDVASGAETQIEFDENGRFERSVDCASYEVLIDAFGELFPIDRVVVDGPELQRDLALPGIRLGGKISYVGALEDRGREASQAQIWLERADGHTAGPSLRQGERYAFLALAPGAYTLRTQPHAFVGAPEGVRVELAIGAVNERLDLELTDP